MALRRLRGSSPRPASPTGSTPLLFASTILGSALLFGAAILATVACNKDGDKSSASASPAPSSPAAAPPSAAAEPAAPAGTSSFTGGFEGAITMHTTNPHAPTADITFLTKGGKLRVDVPAQGGQTAHSLFDSATGKVSVIMDSQRMVLQMPAPTAAATAAAAAKPPTIEKTGKHETIAGYDCEGWNVTTADGKHESLCVAQGLAFFDFAAMAGPAAGAARPWVEELRDKKEFPLRAVDVDPSGKELSRMEVTKIEKKALDDSLFEVPAGYQAMNIPGLGGPGTMPMPGMPGAGGPPGAPRPHAK